MKNNEKKITNIFVKSLSKGHLHEYLSFTSKFGS